MPNRSCYFCPNSYKNNPKAGYFKVTEFMRTKLNICHVEADFICGLHFQSDDFMANGRLRSRAVPSYFPSHDAYLHDHDYFARDKASGPHVDEDFCEGRIEEYICYCCIYSLSWEPPPPPTK